MTDRDLEGFGVVLLGLGETYGEVISPARMEIYFRALSDLSLEQVRLAATEHVRASRFFPKPAELREAVNGDVTDRAELAWMAVQSLVRRHGYWADPKDIAWPDAITQHAALKLYGGWRALCEKLPASGPEMLGTAKLFKAQYAAVAREAQRLELPPSQGEARQVLSGLKDALHKRGLPDHGMIPILSKRERRTPLSVSAVTNPLTGWPSSQKGKTTGVSRAIRNG